MEYRRSPSPFAIPLLFTVFSALLCLFVWVLGAWASEGQEASTPTHTPAETAAADGVEPNAEGELPPWRVVVIDAGHGGEDAGASSAAGLHEKDVNLAVAIILRDLLEMNGVPTVMTRTEDKLLYDRNVNYEGRKKVLDLAARMNAVSATEGALLVSIHMNAFPQTQYHGMQVWYGTHDPRSAEIAAAMREAGLLLQPDNRRQTKAADSGIFLLDRAQTPAVLVECGFLSNPAEAAKLGDPTYQRQVALAIFSGIMAEMG